MRASRERIDFSPYLGAFAVFARNPTVIVFPLLVNVIGIFVAQISGASGGGIGAVTGGIESFLLLLLQLFALGVSIVIGDMGWRRRSVSFDDAWQDARRRGGDILVAAVGFTFVLSITQYTWQLLGDFGYIITAIAVFGTIYTIAASAIGGVPGGAALNASVERVKSAPLTAALLTVVTIVLAIFFDAFVGNLIAGFVLSLSNVAIIAEIAVGVVHAITAGYVAIVMAKVFSDVSFRGL